jgi:hypothetical protein
MMAINGKRFKYKINGVCGRARSIIPVGESPTPPCVRIVVVSKINFRGQKNESKIYRRL